MHLKSRVLILLFCLSILGFAGDDEHKSSSKKFAKVLELIDENYIDSVCLMKITESAITEMLKKMDAFSTYKEPQKAKKENQRLNGKFYGLGVSMYPIEDTIVITSIMEYSPLQKLGVSVFDKLLSLNDSTVVGKSVKYTTNLIDNLPINVKLKLMRRDSIFSVSANKTEIQVNSVSTACMLTDSIAYIKLEIFDNSSAEAIYNAYKPLESRGARCLVLDLRNNTGGYLAEGIKTASLFLENGQEVITAKNNKKHKNVKYVASGKHKINANRLAILVNGLTASSSEIISGAIQDWDRGVIVGEKTYGKGSIQQQFFLDDGSLLRLTNEKYYTPCGRSISRNVDKKTKGYYSLTTFRIITEAGGITPDIIAKDYLSETDSLTLKIKEDYYYKQVLKHLLNKKTVFIKNFPSFELFNSSFEPFLDMKIKGGKFSSQDSLKLKTYIKSTISDFFYKKEETYKIFRSIDLPMFEAIKLLDNRENYLKKLNKTSF